MSYTVQIEHKARRQLAALPDQMRARIEPRLEALAEDPRPRGAIKLRGGQNIYRIRVGQYRVLYEVRDDVLVVLVVEVGHRRDVYR